MSSYIKYSKLDDEYGLFEDFLDKTRVEKYGEFYDYTKFFISAGQDKLIQTAIDGNLIVENISDADFIIANVSNEDDLVFYRNNYVKYGGNARMIMLYGKYIENNTSNIGVTGTLEDLIKLNEVIMYYHENESYAWFDLDYMNIVELNGKIIDNISIEFKSMQDESKEMDEMISKFNNNILQYINTKNLSGNISLLFIYITNKKFKRLIDTPHYENYEDKNILKMISCKESRETTGLHCFIIKNNS